VAAHTAAPIDLYALSKPLTHLSAWRITAPTWSPTTLLQYYREAKATTGVPRQLLAAIHLVDTKMSRLRSASNAARPRPPCSSSPRPGLPMGGASVMTTMTLSWPPPGYPRAMGAPGDLAGPVYHYDLATIRASGAGLRRANEG
jgi:hypothetical protein